MNTRVEVLQRIDQWYLDQFVKHYDFQLEKDLIETVATVLSKKGVGNKNNVEEDLRVSRFFHPRSQQHIAVNQFSNIGIELATRIEQLIQRQLPESTGEEENNKIGDKLYSAQRKLDRLVSEIENEAKEPIQKTSDGFIEEMIRKRFKNHQGLALFMQWYIEAISGAIALTQVRDRELEKEFLDYYAFKLAIPIIYERVFPNL